MIYYVIDTETTGLKLAYHEITQISIIRCSDRVQLSKYIKAEHPERASEIALEITNRRREDLINGDLKEDVVKLCHDFFEKDGLTPEHRCIIGHKIIGFDRRFLRNLWQECGKEFPAICWLDTIDLSKEYNKLKQLNEKKFSLDNALRMVGLIQSPGAHNAVVDSRDNYRLYEQLKKEGVVHIPFIKRLAEEEDQ